MLQIQATGLQKKKNNIIALAAQAQGLQERLNEQYAQNRRTKQEARRKYGMELVYHPAFAFTYLFLIDQLGF